MKLLLEGVSEAERTGAPCERGLSLLALAELYGTWSIPAAGRKPFRRTLRKAIRVLSGLGAWAAMDRARELAPPDLAATL